MYKILRSIALAYLARIGAATNSNAVGRGLFRAIRQMVDGHYRKAGIEALAALATPAMMSYASIALLVFKLADGAFKLASRVLEAVDVPRFQGREAV